MATSLIVIRLVPPAAVAATPLGSTPPSFTDYLAQNGGLRIDAHDVSYSSPTTGTLVGTAIYQAPSTLPQTGSSPGFATVPTPAAYSAGTGIVQELTQQPGDLALNTSPFYQFESVATAVIEFAPPGAGTFFENLRLVATWVTGGAEAFSITQDYYDVALQPGPTPSPDTLVTTTYTVSGTTVFDTTDAWTALPPSLYLTVPPPATPGATNFTLPSNGTAPPFDKLQTAIQAVLAIDPGGAAPDAGKLTFAQCQNIAYEIVWSQQPPLPVPPDPIENLYTNPPNDGALMNGSTPNQDEGDRQQFQAQLTGYYALADATAARLTNFIFSFAMAVACEELSLAATKVYLEFPANPAEANSQDAEIILGSVGTATSNFGVPAAYFYALTASMPSSMLAQQRYNFALDENLPQMLADMTSAFNAGVITDAEAFSSPGAVPPAMNMAQAVRRLQALNVPSSSSLNPLPLDATVQPVVTDWLKFAAADPSPSSESYQPTDELAFWTNESTGQPAGFLELVLWALTQGYMIPAPTNASLASVITSTLPLAPPSVASLVAVTNAQWTGFFTAHPAWLPPVAQSGNLAARISNFLAFVQKFFSVSDSSVASTIYYVTTIDAKPTDAFGGKVLTFASTTGVVAGMSVSGAVSAITTIAAGTMVASPPPPNPTLTAVTLSKPVTGDVPAGTTITFTSNYTTSGTSGWQLLQAPSTDWIGSCLTAYGGGFTFGSGFNLSTLQTAAGTVFPNDPCAQAWLVNAMLAIDALYQILVKAALPVTPNFEFSIVEALYARGFTSAADVTELSSSDFQAALTGTVAYDSATPLFAAAQIISPNTPPSSSGGTFHPVNPDGLLTNCIPAPCRSPLGPIEYLHELLQVSPSGTCSNPVAAPAAGQSTLGSVIALRRGPVGQLAASCANLETPLPLVDIVNECLEFMASAAPAANGAVYNTSADAVAGYALCKQECPPEEKPHFLCHDAAELLCALPEYSTPGTPAVSSNPLESNQTVEPLVWNTLKSDFSACCLPYAQALDVSRTYLRHLSSCRFEVMRTFRKCITEFVLDPDNPPSGFENYLWRYPVRIDIAIEYLGITPEEFQQVFQGVWPQSCGPALDRNQNGRKLAALQVAQLYGFSSTTDTDNSWEQTLVQLPEFLRRTCLSYCEFVELWKSQFVLFNDGGDQKGNFPDCEPCCLEQHWLQFPGQSPNQPPQPTQPPDPNQPVGTPTAGSQAAPQAGPGEPTPQSVAPQPNEQGLSQLWVFIRLWRKLKDLCNAGYSFAQLRDICDVLQLFTGGSINPDFIRQLAAFQMLRDQFKLPLVNPADKPAPGAIDAARTQILALWAGESAAQWPWAVRQLCEGVQRHARCRYKCDHRSAEFVKMLASHLDRLSVLAGFDPASTTATWQALPTHTLRFAEVLAKIYASRFHTDEIFYLFTAGPEAGGLFPSQGNEGALEYPLNLPDDERHHSLWKLRHRLLEVHISDEEVDHWHWNRIETSLREEFGYKASDILAFGKHFFPSALQSAGYSVSAQERRYSSSLPAAQTTPGMWSTPATGPFQYDAANAVLFFQLPLTDHAVITQLEQVQQLNPNEQNAVQDLYFQPRATLAEFAFLFADFAEAQQHLIQEAEEHERWHYFRRQFTLCHGRCKILAEHLAAHVDFATRQNCPEGVGDAFIVLRELHGDENNPGNWESDPGKPPVLPWPGPNGGAFAALLGLTGTGLLMEYTPAGGSVIWRDLSGPLYAFGHERDHINSPLPTVIPSLGLTLTAAQLLNVSILNGIAADGVSGAWLGGAQGFTVKWSGALLIDREGFYEFCAGAPTDEGERPNMEAAEHSQWLLTLTRDGKTRVVLNHNWPGITGLTVPCPHLKAGVYDIVVEFSEPSPAFATKKEHRLHTGFQVKFMGPDCDDRMVQIPHSRLFRISKDLQTIQTPTGESYQDLGYGITGLAAGATSYLNTYYSSSLRDIRRTYQRAFKALLFAHRFPLSSKRRADGHSELGFLLTNSGNFAGLAYYLSGGAYVQHAAYFDFDFLPLVDNYHAPTPAQDSRTQPSAQQSQAIFDWFERIFDYVHARDQVWSEHHCDLWALFDEAVQSNPTNPADLLRHMGARKRDWPLDLRYYQDQFNPPYSVTSNDLEDDRWVVRAWHADRLVRILLEGSSDHDAALARPDLWAPDDPSALVGIETVTGNANLSTFLCDRCFNYDSPRRYGEIRKLNDGLRDRGRCALICYLCAMDRVALPWTAGQFAHDARDLSDLLLLDVEAGICEKASRIEEAITAVQNFIRRARLGLEPNWPVTRDFAQMWDRHFASFHDWQACQRRHLYKENYIEWEELEKARRIEAFRLLETQLGRDALSIAAPGGLEWWPDQRPPAHSPIDLLQKIEPDTTLLLAPEREGFTLIGTPERDARPSWLAVVQSAATPALPPASTPASLPFWLEAAIGMGQRFLRIAAAGVPPASSDCTCATNAIGVCCKECGCKQCPLVDEYYFWLVPGQYYAEPPNPQQNGQASSTPNPDDYQYGFQDDFYSQSEQQSGWQDPTQLPQMLAWNASPLVRLAWCRVHNGEFQQPRSSSMGVAVQPNTVNDLTFLGRTADSLSFSVSNPSIASLPPALSDPSAPGFRYDLAADYAVVLPQVAAPAPLPTYPGNLPSYPYFAYVAPGTHLLPLSYFSPANALAKALRTHCNFEAALKWYRLAFDPLDQDCTWVHCPQTSDTPPTRDQIAGLAVATASTACCDSTKVSPATARNRSIILHFLETLREWGDAAMRGNSPEHFQHARLLFDTMEMILGRRPVSLQLSEPATPQTVANYVPDFPPLNPRLMDLYDVARDRLDLIHNCMNASRLRNGHPRRDMAYFGNSRLREGWKTAEERCCEEMFWCHLHNPYRFLFQIQKAKEFAAKVSQWGGQLVAAYEKGDAEYLASMQANQQRELLDLQLAARQDQWRNADWQVEALQKTKAISEANLAYYKLLIQNGLITDEVAYQDLTIASTVLRAAGDVLEGIAGGVELTPNTFTGGAGFGGSPLFYVQLPIGQPLAGSFSIAARIMNGLSAIAGTTAGLELTEGGWQRRLDDWNHQVTTLTIDIERIELQILGAQRQRDENLNDLNVHQRQLEHSAEVLNFLRDKFTAHDLYLFYQKETSDLYFKLYELALQWACSAQGCFNLERGHTTRRFIPECTWNCLQEGLLAGERLEAALYHMEKSYLDENVREYELTKYISLRENFPLEYLRLRTTGFCEIDIPECMFDHDYPGMYMRRIKNVSLTIPCVTGPFNNVNCRLTLLSSVTRIDPRLEPPAHRCCCDRRDLCECELCPCDPRAVRQYAAREAIATSSGKNDSGLFELNFADDRYLPFEYQGAASHWRVELPRENNYFDLDTVSDLILRLNYTAREGGELLRRATNECAKKRLPGDGWCFFDVRHDFPDSWELLRMATAEERRCKELNLKLTRRMFPYVPGFRDVRIDKITLVFEPNGPEHHGCEVGECACLERKPRDSYEVGLVIRPAYERDREYERLEAACVRSEDCPDLYVGNFEIELSQVVGEVAARFEFPHEIEKIARVYLFCHYTVAR
jgi:hypothetical protein